MHPERGLDHSELRMSALLVETHGNGVYSRLGIVAVQHADWKAASPQKAYIRPKRMLYTSKSLVYLECFSVNCSMQDKTNPYIKDSS